MFLLIIRIFVPGEFTDCENDGGDFNALMSDSIDLLDGLPTNKFVVLQQPHVISAC